MRNVTNVTSGKFLCDAGQGPRGEGEDRRSGAEVVSEVEREKQGQEREEQEG